MRQTQLTFFKPASPSQGSARNVAAFLRRAFDVACAAGGLILLLPLFALIALAIKWQDGGPVFYRQWRMGKGLRKFQLFKFRSMYPNASSAMLLTGPSDPRVTPVGRFIRKYKLDELPQLLNVLAGDMQLVGVRPQVERYVRFYPVEYGDLLQDRPGITDLASLAYRNEEQLFRPGSLDEQYISRILPRKLQLALRYQKARTFSSDIEILFRTVFGFKSPALGWRTGKYPARADVPE